jgi:membrane-bound metal-dependent hydrolase YbcI (DUF457 family)
MTLAQIFIIIFFHWLFDFFLQTDDMAKNKSSSNLALGQHVSLYTVGLFFMSCLLFSNTNFAYGLIWVVVNGVLHFFTDYVTSRATSLLYKDEKYHDFFVTIGFDQMIHYVTLFGTYVWLRGI